jgi:hypothetical protein
VSLVLGYEGLSNTPLPFRRDHIPHALRWTSHLYPFTTARILSLTEGIAMLGGIAPSALITGAQVGIHLFVPRRPARDKWLQQCRPQQASSTRGFPGIQETVYSGTSWGLAEVGTIGQSRVWGNRWASKETHSAASVDLHKVLY